MAEEDEIAHAERPSGLLTKADRRFLLGEMDMSQYDDPEGAAKQRRWRIRRRLKNALLDFYLINETLSLNDTVAVFEEIYDWSDKEQAEYLSEESLSDAPPLLHAWRATIEYLVFAFGYRHDQAAFFTEMAISNAIYEFHASFKGEYVDVPVRVNIDWDNATRYQLDELQEELTNNDDFPEDEGLLAEYLRALVRGGELSEEEADRLYQEKTDE